MKTEHQDRIPGDIEDGSGKKADHAQYGLALITEYVVHDKGSDHEGTGQEYIDDIGPCIGGDGRCAP